MVEEGGCGVGVDFASIAVVEDSIDIFSGDLVGEIVSTCLLTHCLVIGCVYALS